MRAKHADATPKLNSPVQSLLMPMIALHGWPSWSFLSAYCMFPWPSVLSPWLHASKITFLPMTDRYCYPKRRRELSDAARARVAEFRLASRGDLKGAIRLLASSENLVSSRDEDILQEMILKHPAPQDDDVAPSLPSVRPPRGCSSDEVVSAPRSFPLADPVASTV